MARTLLRVALAVLLVGVATACAAPTPAPAPPRTYTAWLSSSGGAVNYHIQVDGAFVDQGDKQPLGDVEAYVKFPVQAGQRVTFTAAVARTGYAGCRVVRDDGVEVVPEQQQPISLRPGAPPVECTFIG